MDTFSGQNEKLKILKIARGQKKWANGHFFFKSGQATNGYMMGFVRVRGHFPTFFAHLN